ncbi:MAG: hypothetical protein ABL959_01760 [Pyrinomonadaceae bacterium]
MAIQQSSFYCPVCQQQRLFTRQESVNHILHLLVTLFSCGLWAFVWIILTLSHNPRFHCSQCGHSDAYKYLANPNLRSQEAQHNASQASHGDESVTSAKAVFHWFSGLSSQAKALTIVLVAVLGVFVIGVAYTSSRNAGINRTSNSNANAITSPDTISISTPPTPVPYPSQQAPNPKFVQKSDSCSDITSELAVVESEQANVERLLDQTEDYSEEGTIKKSLYLNALKRKGDLQLRHIALQRKLKACGKKK